MCLAAHQPKQEVHHLLVQEGCLSGVYLQNGALSSSGSRTSGKEITDDANLCKSLGCMLF